MKKFIILLLAVAGFCRELNVSDLDGNEIKFELKDSTLFENGKKIGEYNKTSAASIILAGNDGVEADGVFAPIQRQIQHGGYGKTAFGG